jgi:hypothetical protein
MAGPRLILARTPSGSCNSSSSHLGHASQRASPAYRKCSPFPKPRQRPFGSGYRSEAAYVAASFICTWRGRSYPDGGVELMVVRTGLPISAEADASTWKHLAGRQSLALASGELDESASEVILWAKSPFMRRAG